MSKRYNGWTNYETWCVDLWLGNDEGTYNYWQEQAADVKRNYIKDDQAEVLADMLKEYIEEQAEEAIPEASMFSDLLRAAVSEVNFGEITKHMFDAVEEEESEG